MDEERIRKLGASSRRLPPNPSSPIEVPAAHARLEAFRAAAEAPREALAIVRFPSPNPNHRIARHNDENEFIHGWRSIDQNAGNSALEAIG